MVLGRTVSKCEAVAGEITVRGGDVNNAHTKKYVSLRRMTDAAMDTMWQSGPMACLRFMRACFPHLRASQGCIVNMGSGSSIMPTARWGATR
jgi:meso-butanediol dehydrogenase / (S,S)-butanediol dehydrogenase / diacetyl reductase